MRKTIVLRDRLLGACHCPVTVTMSVTITKITKVRTNVAKSEFVFVTPTFAKMAVSAAKHAERSAQINQVLESDLIYAIPTGIRSS